MMRMDLRPAEAPAPVALGLPGKFMRASLPRPSTSCSGTIAMSATRGAGGADQVPGDVVRRRSRGSAQTVALLFAGAVVPPAERRCRCRACRCRRRCRGRSCAAGSGLSASSPKANCRMLHARQAERVAQCLHVGRDEPRSSAMSGRPPSASRERVEQRRPGPGTQRPSTRRGLARRDLPVAPRSRGSGRCARDPPARSVAAQRARSTRRSRRSRMRVPVGRADCPSAGRWR